MTRINYHNLIRNLHFEPGDRERIVEGARKIGSLVGATLGPGGHTTLIQQPDGSAYCTKDGAISAMAVYVADPLENAAIQAIKQASINTANRAGDGTTTSTVLAATLVDALAEPYVRGDNLASVLRSLRAAELQAQASLKAQRRDTEPGDIQRIAMVSSNGHEQMSGIVAAAFERVGLGGQIIVEESPATETKLTFSQGFEITSGWAHKAFSLGKRSIQFQDAFVWLVPENLALYNQAQQLLPVLNYVASQGKPLVLIADEIDGDVLKSLIVNVAEGRLEVCAVKAPGYAEERRAAYEDIAHLTGATLRDKQAGSILKDIKPTELGRAPLVQITAGATLFDGLTPRPEYVADLEATLAETTRELERNKLQSRIARLNSKIAHIMVGAETALEAKELKDRYDDTVSAVRASREGVLPGAGRALLTAADALSGTGPAVDALRAALRRPSILLRENAGCDVSGEGILDPYLVPSTALSNAVSVACTLLSCRNLISFA